MSDALEALQSLTLNRGIDPAIDLPVNVLIEGYKITSPVYC
jgi:hypothetical protein